VELDGRVLSEPVRIRAEDAVDSL